MLRSLSCFILALAMLASSPPLARAADAPATAPAPSPEQKVLDRFVGTWRATFRMPKAEHTPQETQGSADLVYTHALGGQYVQAKVEYSNDASGMAMYTYDVQKQCYRLWWFSSVGYSNQSTGVWDAATSTMTWSHHDENGDAGVGRYAFVDEDTIKWNIVVKDAKGKVLFLQEGVTKRVKDVNAK